MSDLICITIDNKECFEKEGTSVLNTARANGIFIPAVCYQSKCSPTLACRLCLVESDGKQIYSCNSKIKEGMNIKTNTFNIEAERRAIMEVYDVNHPLQCGVCDMSGECELQNYSLYMKVDSQHYSIKDIHRPTSHWGVMDYDSSLCIVCEKCVTVCKDMIGSSALSTIKRESEPLDKSFKENMPKDAYAMWNKLNKSLIGYDEDACIDCGECISVCPVGALVSSDFKYKSNAWELTKIPAANPYSSDCAFMYYETKPISIAQPHKKMIYRVTNEAHYQSLSGAARFGFDYPINDVSKDEELFIKAIETFKNAKSVGFNSFITNEEAYILQKLKEKYKFKLVNKDAFKYKIFLEKFSATSGKSLYSGSLDSIHNANFVVSIGSYFKSDAPNVRFAFNNSIVMNKGVGLYFHPLNDTTVMGFGKKGKTIESIQYAPLSEEAVLLYILDIFGENLPVHIKEYLDSFKETKQKTIKESFTETLVENVVDDNGEEKLVERLITKDLEKVVEYSSTKLLEMMQCDENLTELIENMRVKKDKFSLIVGADLYSHPESNTLARLCGLIQRYTQFQVIIIPSQTNTLGVSLICQLDDFDGELDVGYNEKAKFELSAFGDGDFDIPTLLQQEGTFTNIDKRVVPTNVALKYNGYTLNDLANQLLESEVKYTINYTKEIFLKKDFDSLDNYFTNSFEERRGYLLEIEDRPYDDHLEFHNIKALDGQIVYNANPINQFNEFTSLSKQLKHEKMGIYMSPLLASKLNVTNYEKIEVDANKATIVLEAFIDNQIDGEIAYISTFEKNALTRKLFNGYRFTNASLKKV